MLHGPLPTTACCRAAGGRHTTRARSARRLTAPACGELRCTPRVRSSVSRDMEGWRPLGRRKETEMKFGLLLPHFGEHADKDKLLKGSQRAEELGFDSVWVRDHLVFEPHG